MDAWTGEVSPIDTYRRQGDRVTVQLRLQANDATIVALAGQAPSWGRAHVVSTTADHASIRHGKVVLRDETPGSYTATLSNGRTVRGTIGALPAPVSLDRWHLSAEDWRPGASATSTVKVPHELDLDGLAAWPDIPELQDASGVGRYTTTVTLGSGWQGAYLDLGEVYDTFRVTVNGRALGPVDQLDTRVDLGRLLHPGTNTIGVEEATSLNNRMRVVDPSRLGTRPRRPYGLVGPVTLRPYGSAATSGH
jgi:hypothetical protein